MTPYFCGKKQNKQQTSSALTTCADVRVARQEDEEGPQPRRRRRHGALRVRVPFHGKNLELPSFNFRRLR